MLFAMLPIPVIIAFVLICLEKNNRHIPRAIHIIFLVLSAPFFVFEYFCLFWFWGGDGLFALVAVPVIYVITIISHLMILRKFKHVDHIQKALILSAIFITPILTGAILFLLAYLFSVQIMIA